MEAECAHACDTALRRAQWWAQWGRRWWWWWRRRGCRSPPCARLRGVGVWGWARGGHTHAATPHALAPRSSGAHRCAPPTMSSHRATRSAWVEAGGWVGSAVAAAAACHRAQQWRFPLAFPPGLTPTQARTSMSRSMSAIAAMIAPASVVRVRERVVPGRRGVWRGEQVDVRVHRVRQGVRVRAPPTTPPTHTQPPRPRVPVTEGTPL